jgi:hypothetical protein
MKRLTTLLLLALIATTLVAQRRSRNSDALPNTPYDGKFTFVRIKYNPGGMGGDGGFGYGDPRWNHDYPRAEAHFGKILSELSLVPTFLGGGNVLTFDDPELFNYPIAYLTEPGFWSVNQKETEGMRDWLAKGGFLIVDDFVGNQWYNFEEKLRIVLPDGPAGEARREPSDLRLVLPDCDTRLLPSVLPGGAFGVLRRLRGQ